MLRKTKLKGSQTLSLTFAWCDVFVDFGLLFIFEIKFLIYIKGGTIFLSIDV